MGDCLILYLQIIRLALLEQNLLRYQTLMMSGAYKHIFNLHAIGPQHFSTPHVNFQSYCVIWNHEVMRSYVLWLLILSNHQLAVLCSCSPLACNCYKPSFWLQWQASTNHFAPGKCTVAAAGFSSVQILYSIGNIWWIFLWSHISALCRPIETLFFIIFGIWRVSWWYIICRYIMLAAKDIKGKRMLKWTQT